MNCISRKRYRDKNVWGIDNLEIVDTISDTIGDTHFLPTITFSGDYRRRKKVCKNDRMQIYLNNNSLPDSFFQVSHDKELVLDDTKQKYHLTCDEIMKKLGLKYTLKLRMSSKLDRLAYALALETDNQINTIYGIKELHSFQNSQKLITGPNRKMICSNMNTDENIINEMCDMLSKITFHIEGVSFNFDNMIEQIKNLQVS